MKKLCIALALLLTLCIGVALADEPFTFTSGDYKYILLEDGTAQITKYTGKDDVVSVPERLNGHAMSAIGDIAFEKCSLKQIIIPDCVTTVGANPFYNCKNLSTIIVSPDHPTLATIDNVLFSKADKRLICHPVGLKSTSYSIPAGIRIIGSRSFGYHESLKTITIPDTVTTIEDLAFFACYDLNMVSLPDGVTTMGANPFTDCESLDTFIVSPDHPTLAIIDGVLFEKPTKTLICYPQDRAGTRYTVPNGILCIGNRAFFGCRLNSVELPDTITVIDDYAFVASTGLQSINIPDGVTYIGYRAFAEDSKLAAITLPDSVTEIGADAFKNCRVLSVTVSRDSFAASYCKEYKLNYTYRDALDWLFE